MSEPKPSQQYEVIESSSSLPRAVPVVLSLDWAQAVVRLQQLHNEGCTLVRISSDERGRVRIEPND